MLRARCSRLQRIGGIFPLRELIEGLPWGRFGGLSQRLSTGLCQRRREQHAEAIDHAAECVRMRATQRRVVRRVTRARQPAGPVPARAHHRRQPARPAAPPRECRGHRRRLLPHAPGQSQERNHPEQDLINPRDGDFYLATSGDKNLAVDTNASACNDRTGRQDRSRSPSLPSPAHTHRVVSM